MAGLSQLLKECTKQPLGLSTGSNALEGALYPSSGMRFRSRTNLWCITRTGGAIISRSVTSCAGMTTFLVLLAQTRVSFLSRGREKSFHQLPAPEQASQKEEAYASCSCSHPSATDLLHHGPFGHARTRWSCDHHRLLEIWCQFQWT